MGWHNPERVESSIGPLLPLFQSERAAGRPLVLGVVLATAGSTYRKPGALMLIASNGEIAGLLSGGCLEGDLREHASDVFASGTPRKVSYDMRGPEDLLWGLGLGCEGAMDILLARMGPDNAWQPLAHFAQALSEHRPASAAIVTESPSSRWPSGLVVLPETCSDPLLASVLEHTTETGSVEWFTTPDGAKLFVLPLTLPPRVLLLGAGPDALPVVEFAARLGWKVTVVDHRGSYAQPSRFPAAERVVLTRPEDLAASVPLNAFDAAVVMSHHLPSDLEYLRVLATTTVPYVGLLGPAVRREKLLADVGAGVEALRARLHAPVGLALGGRAPESIALAIVAEIHAFLHGAAAGPFGAPQK